MSARKILRRNSQMLLKNNTITKAQQTNIITLYNDQCIKFLSQPTRAFPHRIQKNSKSEVQKYKYLTAMRKTVYITGGQCNDIFNIVVLHRNPLTNKWIDNSYSNHQDFDLYFNPTINKFYGEATPMPQSCQSFPFIKSIVDRYPKIQLNYDKALNLHDKTTAYEWQNITETIQGFKAIVFQHCIDHLLGQHFFTPNISKGRLSIDYSPQNLKNTKFLLTQYNVKMKNLLQDHKISHQQFQSIKIDYQQRITKQYKKQLQKIQALQKKNNFQLLF